MIKREIKINIIILFLIVLFSLSVDAGTTDTASLSLIIANITPTQGSGGQGEIIVYLKDITATVNKEWISGENVIIDFTVTNTQNELFSPRELIFFFKPIGSDNYFDKKSIKEISTGKYQVEFYTKFVAPIQNYSVIIIAEQDNQINKEYEFSVAEKRKISPIKELTETITEASKEIINKGVTFIEDKWTNWKEIFIEKLKDNLKNLKTKQIILLISFGSLMIILIIFMFIYLLYKRDIISLPSWIKKIFRKSKV